jgi:hypothetical protein
MGPRGFRFRLNVHRKSWRPAFVHLSSAVQTNLHAVVLVNGDLCVLPNRSSAAADVALSGVPCRIRFGL